MRLSLILPLIALTLLPNSAQAATGSAAAGLEAIKQYNLIVFEDLNASHDVEGKTLVGRDLKGNAATFGLGNAKQGAAISSAPTLTVGRHNSLTNANINNGKNGLSGNVSSGPGFWVGGNVTGNANMNGGNYDILVGGNLGGNPTVNGGNTLRVGGNVSGVLSMNGGTAQLGGTPGGLNNNSGSYQSGLGASFASGLASTVTDKTTQVIADVKALSSTLAGLTVINPSTVTSNSQTLFLNAVDGGGGFALFNLDSSVFGSLTKIDYLFADSTLPIIVNVTGAANLTFGLEPTGSNTSALNQQIIWNFVDATSLNITKLFHGSVLAPNATLYNHTPIEGSVVAKNFIQDGEVHLGTYNGNGSFLTPPPAAVPEPASWAMMIAGLGSVGALLRRRTRAAPAMA
jgi:choice-of-anchor A domain-containing protein